MRTPSLRLRIALWATGSSAAAALLLSGSGAAVLPGPTTIDRTIADLNGDGRLEYSTGEPVILRQDLAKAIAGREARRKAVVSFVGFTDFQLADEESVSRAPWADKCTAQNPFLAAFRPQETMVVHLINSNIRAANQIGAGPVTHRPFDFGIQLGDAADNVQRNETRWFIDLLDGYSVTHRLLDPDSGNHNTYEGPQGSEPFPTPVKGRSILELANDPFYAPGLRRADGSPLPWYSVLGNHDNKIQGTVPNLPGWWEFIRAYSQGPLFLRDLAPDDQQELCANPALAADPAFWTRVLARPGLTSIVTPDASRVQLTRNQWMAEHLPPAQAKAIDNAATGSNGLPAGHGFLEHRCTDTAGGPLDRLCYAFDRQNVHFIVLDTNPDEGLQDGNIDEAQLAWFERELAAHSTRYYDANGALKTNPAGHDGLIAVFSHHTRDTMDESFPIHFKTTDHTTVDRLDPSGRAFAAEFEAMMLRFPNVVLHGAGHTHENRIWARPGRPADASQGLPATGYWEVNSSSHADWPHQSRTIEIADNADGTLSIFGVVFDIAAPPRALRADKAGDGGLAWSADPTDETAFGAPAKINEEYLASAGLEVGYSDPQAGHADANAPGRDASDRNVEMVIRNPLAAAAGPVTANPSGVPSLPSVKGVTLVPPAFPGAGLPDSGTPTSAFNRTYPFGATGRGLGAPATSGPIAIGSLRGAILLVLAAATLVWIVRVRVRRRMIGLEGGSPRVG